MPTTEEMDITMGILTPISWDMGHRYITIAYIWNHT